MTRVAGILVNIVPYHHARWEAFAVRWGGECHVLELTSRDEFAVLEFAAPASYHRSTLFPGTARTSISTKALSRSAAAALTRLRPHVVCVSGYAAPVSLAALQWALDSRVPVVVLSESNEFDEPRSAMKEFIKRRIIGLCSAGLAGGKPQSDYLVKLGLSRECVSLGYDVVDNRYFEDRAEGIRNQKAESRNRYGLPKRYFVACCRFGEKKNIPRLVEAYARYRQLATETPKHRNTETLACPPWSLVLLGDGEKRPEVEATISQRGVAGSVHLAGARSYDDLPAYYSLAAAFVHASTTEQWGLVVNEAMASGLPVLVSSRCGCAPDLVQEGINGFTFDPYNVEQLAQLMLRLTEAPKHRLTEMGSASRRIISEWGPDRFASGLKAAVGKALEVGSAKPTLLQRAILQLLSRR